METPVPPSSRCPGSTIRQRAVVAVAALVCLIWDCSTHRSPTAETEIFQGVTYGCDRIRTDRNGYGLVHWVRIDLSAPGIEIYVTPLDESAVKQGWQYRLKLTSNVVQREGLAVAINAGLFEPKSRWISLPGDLSRSIETVVADHTVSHIGTTSYLLWFDDDLVPKMETTKASPNAVFSRAKWGMASQGVALIGGVIHPEGIEEREPRSRTAVGIDRARKLLFFAAFECVTPTRAYEKLKDLGIQDGMLLDGGESTAMTLGTGARGLRSGALIGGWRPVATHLGVRAKPLRPKGMEPSKSE